MWVQLHNPHIKRMQFHITNSTTAMSCNYLLIPSLPNTRDAPQRYHSSLTWYLHRSSVYLYTLTDITLQRNCLAGKFHEHRTILCGQHNVYITLWGKWNVVKWTSSTVLTILWGKVNVYDILEKFFSKGWSCVKKTMCMTLWGKCQWRNAKEQNVVGKENVCDVSSVQRLGILCIITLIHSLYCHTVILIHSHGNRV